MILPNARYMGNEPPSQFSSVAHLPITHYSILALIGDGASLEQPCVCRQAACAYAASPARSSCPVWSLPRLSPPFWAGIVKSASALARSRFRHRSRGSTAARYPDRCRDTSRDEHGRWQPQQRHDELDVQPTHTEIRTEMRLCCGCMHWVHRQADAPLAGDVGR